MATWAAKSVWPSRWGPLCHLPKGDFPGSGQAWITPARVGNPTRLQPLEEAQEWVNERRSWDNTECGAGELPVLGVWYSGQSKIDLLLAHVIAASLCSVCMKRWPQTVFWKVCSLKTNLSDVMCGSSLLKSVIAIFFPFSFFFLTEPMSLCDSCFLSSVWGSNPRYLLY